MYWGVLKWVPAEVASKSCLGQDGWSWGRCRHAGKGPGCGTEAQFSAGVTVGHTRGRPQSMACQGPLGDSRSWFEPGPGGTLTGSGKPDQTHSCLHYACQGTRKTALCSPRVCPGEPRRPRRQADAPGLGLMRGLPHAHSPLAWYPSARKSAHQPLPSYPFLLRHLPSLRPVWRQPLPPFAVQLSN